MFTSAHGSRWIEALGVGLERAHRVCVLAALLAVLLFLPSAAPAGNIVTFNLQPPGDIGCGGNLGYVTVTLADQVNSQNQVLDVLLTVTSHLGKGESMEKLDLNLGPNGAGELDPRHLAFSPNANDAATQGTTITTGAPNSRTSLGAGNFDVALAWAPRLDALENGTSVSFKITDSLNPGFGATDFNFPSLLREHGRGVDSNDFAAALVRGKAWRATFTAGPGSVVDPPPPTTPAPPSLVLALTGLAPVAVRAVRRRFCAG